MPGFLEVFRVSCGQAPPGTRVANSSVQKPPRCGIENGASRMRDNQAKLVLFETLRKGALTKAEASLWPVRLRADLVRDGVARTREDGGLELVNVGAYASTPATTVPPPPSQSQSMPAVGVPKPTISARIEPEDLAFLEALETSQGMSRADAIRFLFERARTMGPRFVGSAPRLRKTVGYVARRRVGHQPEATP